MNEDVSTRSRFAPQVQGPAWPEPDHNVGVLNTHNGRPSLGFVSTPGGPLLFWQFYGHGTDVSAWLYTTLTNREAQRVLDFTDNDRLLSNVTHGDGRPAWVGTAVDGRLVDVVPFTLRDTSDNCFVVDMLEASDWRDQIRALNPAMED